MVKVLGLNGWLNSATYDREKEMIKIEQGTSFDGERRRCVIASLTTADGGHDGVADDGNGGGHSLVGISASRQPDLS